MSALVERLKWAMENRGQQNGDAWNATALSIAADLSTAHVGQILRGVLKHPRIGTLRALAKALRVSSRWLARGDGSPDDIDAQPSADAPSAIPMLLWCPACHARHIDEGEFATKVHHTHACQHCGVVWRPAIQPTCGVQFLPGFKNAGVES